MKQGIQLEFGTFRLFRVILGTKCEESQIEILRFAQDDNRFCGQRIQ